MSCGCPTRNELDQSQAHADADAERRASAAAPPKSFPGSTTALREELAAANARADAAEAAWREFLNGNPDSAWAKLRATEEALAAARRECDALRGELARRTEASPDERLYVENERLRRETETAEAERAEWQGRFEEEAEDARTHRAALVATGRGTNGLRAYTDNLRGAADRLLQLWTDFTSQERYGEHLREGMGSDFTVWEEAHDYLRITTNAARKALAAPAAASGEEGKR